MTTYFIDTSVLVPVVFGDHPHHVASTKLLAACKPAQAFCAAHSIVETYSTLTRLPAPFRHSPDEALVYVKRVMQHLTPLALDCNEHIDAVVQASQLKIAGGSTYDYLIWRCAEKARASVVFTWNLKHYLRFTSPGVPLVRIPDQH